MSKRWRSTHIDREFIQTWSAEYRRDADAARWRAGPKFAAVMAKQPEWSTLSGIASYWDFEEYIFDVVGPSVREAGSYTYSQFVTVGYWKSSRSLAYFQANEELADTIRDVTGRVFRPDLTDREKPHALRELVGVGVPVASALLTVWHPDEFTIIDIRALRTLSLLGEAVDEVGFGEHGQPWWENHYDMYLRACRGIAERNGPSSLRQVDRALWKWSQVNAPS